MLLGIVRVLVGLDAPGGSEGACRVGCSWGQ